MLKRRVQGYLCFRCHNVPVKYYRAYCETCKRTSRERVERDNLKMLSWHMKEFGRDNAYQFILSQEEIDVIPFD